ncbi:hypothetical protein V8D89_003879 [Ganoderma adspersum]
MSIGLGPSPLLTFIVAVFEMEDTTASGKSIVDREKTSPFLNRIFVKIWDYHRLGQFEDGPLPLSDEQQTYTWRDAALREVLTTLRSSAPASTESRHPLARYSFRAVFADILRVTGKGGHVDFSNESESAPPHGLRLCVSDLQLVNFMKDRDGRPGIVVMDCGGYSFLPPSFFGMVLGVGSLGHRIETMLPPEVVPRTNVSERASREGDEWYTEPGGG